jgi:predicted dehydrogenase
MKKLRWGFLSTAGIGRKNWVGVRDSGNCVLAAVASRDVERSRRYIAECQSRAAFDTEPEAMGSYEELIDSPDIDAVYIPLPTGLRKEWVIRAAKAGKHVLCEKPCALSAADLEEMIAACRRNNVQFMDGVMFMHHPRFAELRKVLDDGASVGKVRHITSMFTFQANETFFDKNIRSQTQLEPTGCLGDLGWYCIRLALWAKGWQMPVEIRGHAEYRANAAGNAQVLTEFTGEMVFEDGATASFFSSFLAPLQKWGYISGTKGWLRVEDFVLPKSKEESSYILSGSEVKVASSASQEANMLRNFASQVLSGRLNEDWPMWAMKTQRVMDACLK